MTQKDKSKIMQTLAIAGFLALAAVPAYAENGDEVPNEDTSAAVVKVNVAADTSFTDAAPEEIALGYVVGRNGLRNRKIWKKFYRQRGELFRHDGKNYRRVKVVKDNRYGYVSFPIKDRAPFYKRDGSVRTVPLSLTDLGTTVNTKFIGIADPH